MELDALLSLLHAAGWPIWPLLACSIAALAIILERLSLLRPSRVAPRGLLDETLALAGRGQPDALTLARLEQNSVLGALLASGLRAGADPDALHDELDNRGRLLVHQLERNLNALATLASAAPLLGLLGSVVGLIEVFGAQDAAGADPSTLAHGISTALYNTAFGLIIAIPCLLFYRYFRGRVEAYGIELEQAARLLLRQLSR